MKRRDDLTTVPNPAKVFRWGDIADGHVWELSREDLGGREPKAAMMAARNWAKYNRMRAVVSVLPDSLILQFVADDGNRS